MRRSYSNYTDDEFRQIERSAEAAGMTISAFCKTVVIERYSERRVIFLRILSGNFMKSWSYLNEEKYLWSPNKKY